MYHTVLIVAKLNSKILKTETKCIPLKHILGIQERSPLRGLQCKGEIYISISAILIHKQTEAKQK